MKTVQGNRIGIQSFRKGLLTLREGFTNIHEREEEQKVEEFKSAFFLLISKVKQVQENGLWQKVYFNIFETLGYQRLEVVHSNILAWLLSPEESHGLGDKFLRAFVYEVFNKKDLPNNLPVKVFREKSEGRDRPDIIIEGHKWWLVIENKIDSGEQEDQTKRYAAKYKCRGKLRENVFLAFLSPSGWLPKSRDFTPVSYRTIRELLESMNFQGDSDLLIRHFKDHIFLDFGG